MWHTLFRKTLLPDIEETNILLFFSEITESKSKEEVTDDTNKGTVPGCPCLRSPDHGSTEEYTKTSDRVEQKDKDDDTNEI